jgi:D-beta-D-heptose 7-phosphate kinase/D-beta-D-heptose 1-phosphate adenosyltransferase|tara:strand:+ start:697 stop:1086 length:390 start_codon:yes stop_codon:yes gene_type:complete
MKKVWMNGCFDVLHHAHFKMIEFASTFGELVVIGIDSDKRVKKLKGDDRPFHSEEERKYNLERIKGVSKVIIFDSEIMLEEAIKRYQPDIFVIGSDYKDKSIVGEEYSKSMVFFNRMEDFSTTKILTNE